MGCAVRFAAGYAIYAAVVLGYACLLLASPAGALLAPATPTLVTLVAASLALPPLDAAGWGMLRPGRGSVCRGAYRRASRRAGREREPAGLGCCPHHPKAPSIPISPHNGRRAVLCRIRPAPVRGLVAPKRRRRVKHRAGRSADARKKGGAIRRRGT